MELSRIGEKLESIERRLQRLEQLSDSRLDRTNASAVGVGPTRSSEIEVAGVQRIARPITEARSGNWLGSIAVICFVLAAVFIVKLSIDSGWLTPERQIGLSAIFGILLVGTGFKIMSVDREYASYLPAAGMIILLLTNFAAHGLYRLTSFEIAVAIAAILSGACVWLYSEIEHDLYAIVAAVGAYTAPLMLRSTTDPLVGLADPMFPTYYYVICSLGFAAVSMGMRTRALSIVGSYLALLTAMIVITPEPRDLIRAILLAVHFLVFASGAYLQTRRTGRALTEEDGRGLLPVLLMFYALEYHCIGRIQPEWAPWISIGFAGLLLAFYTSARSALEGRNLPSLSMILAFATAVLFHSGYLVLLPEGGRAWLFVLAVLGLVFTPIEFVAPTKRGPLQIPMLAMALVMGIEYVSIVLHLLQHRDLGWIIVGLVALASLWCLLTVGRDRLTRTSKSIDGVLFAAHVLAVLGFYDLASSYGSLAVSAAWLIYAVSVISFAFRRRDETMAKSALLVLGFAAGKALLYDAASAPGVIRISCLVVTGGVLYGSGFLMRQIASWKK